MASSCAAEAPRLLHDFGAAAGPLPDAVRSAVIEACADWRAQGSVLSLSFASDAGRELMQQTRASLVRLLEVPDSHDVLFMQGGASAQFGLVPANLLRSPAEAVLYVESGHWSRRAIAQARQQASVHSMDGRALFGAGATDDAWPLALERATASAGAPAYVHLTSNETADGRQCRAWPECAAPLVVDMTSDFLSRPVDWSRVALAYAALQKLIGVAGLTVVIVRRDLLVPAERPLPRVFDYAAQSAAASRVNTPPLFAIFVAHAMLAWIADAGGLQAVEAAVRRRSERVYRALDEAALYRVGIGGAARSHTSICFAVAARDGDAALVEAAGERGLRGLAGHAAQGGLRLANYAGTSDAAIDELCACLREFARAELPS